MQQYLELLKNILENGHNKDDRTGTGTRSIFGAQMRFDLSKGFPLLTTKKLNIKAITGELLWFLSGETNIKSLREKGIHIWDAWADNNGNLGRVYGYQWRHWNGHYDQIKELERNLQVNPKSRRLIVSAWNPDDIPLMALPPCHCLFQFYVNKGKLSCQLYQRSADMFIGVPFNIASYALLTSMLAEAHGFKAGEFIHTLGDAHIYNNHISQVKEQLSRAPQKRPELIFHRSHSSILDFKADDFEFKDYFPHPAIKAPVAV